jgi:hypothetical protein
MRRWAAICGALVLLAGGLFVVRPFLAKERVYPAEVASPPAVTTLSTVPLAPGAPVCFDHVVVEGRSQVAQFKVSTAARAGGPPLRVTLDGPGYHLAPTVPAGYLDDSVLSVPVVQAPTPTPLHVCIANLGKRPIALFSSFHDRARSRSVAFIGRHDTGQSVWFSFYENKPGTIPEHLSLTLKRMTVFRPHWVGRGLLWVLFFLFLVGVPVAVVVAYVRGVGEEEDVAGGEAVAQRPRWRRWLD